MAGFKDLLVWQKGVELSVEVYAATEKLPKEERFKLSSQMTDAAVSIPSNIAEGHRRNNKKEFIHFLGIALGSAAELETQLIITARVYRHVDVTQLIEDANEIQRMLYSMLKKLKQT